MYVQPCPAPHYKVLPPGKFNGTIPELLPVFSESFIAIYRMVQKMGHHAVCERNLRKLLLNNGFILVECNYMPELEYRDDKELISFAILFVLNILCDVIHDVIHKHVYD